MARWLALIFVLLITSSLWAAGSAGPGPAPQLLNAYSQACNSTPANSQLPKSCQYTLNLVDLGADPHDNVDASGIISAAIATAGSIGGHVVCPPGNYKIANTVNWNVGGITYDGFHCTWLPTSTAPTVLSIALSPPAINAYLQGGVVNSLTIYRDDNRTSGDNVYLGELSEWTFNNLYSQGGWRDVHVQDALDISFNFPQVGGSNTASGTAIWLLDRISGLYQHNSGVKITSDESVGTGSGSGYGVGMFVTDADGLQLVNGHMGFVNGPAFQLNPLNTDDVIDNVFLSNEILDTAVYGFEVNSVPAPGWRINNIGMFGGSIQNITSLGLYISSVATNMSQVAFSSVQFINNNNGCVDIQSGSQYNLAADFFINCNGNGGNAENAVVLGASGDSNGPFDVNLDGAMYGKGGGFTGPVYNILTAGNASGISALSQHFSGAQTGDVSNGTSAPSVTITTASTDQASATTIIYGQTAVTCPAGSPSSSFATKNGMVTHC